MKSLRRAVVVGLVALAACRTTASDAGGENSTQQAPSARELAAVQPEFLPAFDELQRALAAGDDAVARRILRGIQARSPTGRALSLAEAFERVLSGREAVSELRITLVARPEPSSRSGPSSRSEPSRARPSAGSTSSTSGLAATPGSIPASVPSSADAASDANTGGSPNADGSSAASSTATDSSAKVESDDALPPRLEARLFFVVANTSDVPIELRPGPADLHVTKTSVGRPKAARAGNPLLGGEQQSSELHPYPQLRNLRLAPGGTLEIELAQFFIDVPENELAVRLAFDLDLRSGSIVRDGRELPAMHVPVKSCEATRWSKLRYPQWKATPESLEEYVLRTTSINADCALEIAVRMPREDHARALDLLAAREHEISEVHLTELVPALRWLTEDPTLGGDADLWREYLRARAGARPKARPKLELPAQTQ